MAYCDLLRSTALLAAAAATALAAVAVIAADQENDTLTLIVAAAWWPLAAAAGVVLGRPARAAEAVAPVLAAAKTTPSLPTDSESPGRAALARLWPLIAFAIVAGGLGFLWPGVAAVGTGFSLAAALAMRAREAAVTAIEDRDGVRFYVEPSSALEPVRLVRTPGLGRDRVPAGHPPPPPPATE
jgi:hypothetical protein